MVPAQPSRCQRLSPARLAGRGADQLDRVADSDVSSTEGEGGGSAGRGEAVRAATRGRPAAVEETLRPLAADDPRHAVVAAEQLARCAALSRQLAIDQLEQLAVSAIELRGEWDVHVGIAPRVRRAGGKEAVGLIQVARLDFDPDSPGSLVPSEACPPSLISLVPRRTQADPVAQTFGGALRAAREARGETLKDVAARVPRLDPRYLGEIKLGWHSPTIVSCKRLADALHTSLAELVQTL